MAEVGAAAGAAGVTTNPEARDVFGRFRMQALINNIQQRVQHTKRRREPFALHQAVRENDEEAVKKLVDELRSDWAERASIHSGISRMSTGSGYESFLSQLDDENYTPVHYAARFNSIEALTVLLRENADPNVPGEEGFTAMHLAAKHDNLKVLELLLLYIKSDDRRVDQREAIRMAVNEPNNFGETALHLACSRNSISCVEKLLEAGTDVNKKDDGDVTPLHVACAAGNTDVAAILIKRAADVHALTVNGTTPLQLAATEGNVKVAELLLGQAKEIDFNRPKLMTDAMDYDGNSSLHLAVQNRHVGMAKLLISFGADVKLSTKSGLTPLHIAARNGFLNVAQLLVEKGASKMEVDVDGNLPLHRAAQFGRTEIAQFLLSEEHERLSTLNATTATGYTPLMYASWQGHAEVVCVLLKCKANPMVADKFDKTCLHYAISNEHLDVVRVLLGEQELMDKETVEKLISYSDKYDRIPLHNAAKSGHVEIVSALVDAGSDIDNRDDSELTPLHVAIRNGRTDAVAKLLECDISLAKDEEGRGMTGLHLAAQRGYYQIVQTLIDSAALVDARDDFHQTPLDMAAAAGHVRCCLILLENDCLVDPRDKLGVTPLMQAAQQGHWEVVLLLLDWHADLAAQDVLGRTALDIAAEGKHATTAKSMINHKRWREVLDARVDVEHCEAGADMRQLGMTPFKRLVIDLPEVARLVLNKCHSDNGRAPDNAGYEVVYDFRYLEDDTKIKYPAGTQPSPSALELMTKLRRRELLTHRVVDQLLQLKWESYGRLTYYLNMFYYILYVVFVTYFVVDNPVLPSLGASNTLSVPSQVAQIAAVVFIVIGIIGEVFQFIQAGVAYFSWKNVLDWSTYITGFVFFLPFDQQRNREQWNAGAINVFLVWMDLVVFARQFTGFGVYILMLTDTLVTVAKVMLVFSVFIVAFALGFYVMLQDQESFSTIPKAFVKTLVMMTGEYEYDGIFTNSDPACLDNTGTVEKFVCTLRFEGGLYVMFIIFVLLMNIVLMNLLIGLAVGDIEAVGDNAVLAQQAMRSEFLSNIEKWIPGFLRRRAQVQQRTTRPNGQVSLFAYLFGAGSNTEEEEESTPIEELRGDSVIMRRDTNVMRAQVKSLTVKCNRQNAMLKELAKKFGVDYSDKDLM